MLFAVVVLLLVLERSNGCTSLRAVPGHLQTWDFVGIQVAEVPALHPLQCRALTAQAVLMNAFVVACRKSCLSGWLPRAVELQKCGGISPGTHSPRCC